MDFLIEHGVSWKGWAKRVPAGEQDEIVARLAELQGSFGRPHLHSGLGLRRLRGDAFEFRASRAPDYFLLPQAQSLASAYGW